MARAEGSIARSQVTTRRAPRGGARTDRATPAALPPTDAQTRDAASGTVLVISGLSGAGKSQAAKILEDLGYYCVDNLPPELLDQFLDLRNADPQRYRDVALVLDIRSGDPAPAIAGARQQLAALGTPVRLIYLEASDATLVSRFSETRHRHPLGGRTGVTASIAEERRLLAETRSLADQIIDTSALSTGQLRERLFPLAPRDGSAAALEVEIVTFGFKFGIPLDADLVFDVRFLTNPFYVPDLKPLSGLQEPVREFVLGQPRARRFLQLVGELLDLTIAPYRSEGKSRLTVALGCTGGYHRSIALAEELAEQLRDRPELRVTVFHRELER
jgi:UPF0042 nucleotide-binding protein